MVTSIEWVDTQDVSAGAPQVGLGSNKYFKFMLRIGLDLASFQ